MVNSSLSHAGISVNKLHFISVSINEFMPNVVYIQTQNGDTIFQSFKDTAEAKSHLQNLLNHIHKK